MVLRGKYEIITVKCDDALISQGEASSAWRYRQSFAGEKEQDLQWRPDGEGSSGEKTAEARRQVGRQRTCPGNRRGLAAESEAGKTGRQGDEDSQHQAKDELLWRATGVLGARWQGGKESTCQRRRRKFDPWIVKMPWRRRW